MRRYHRSTYREDRFATRIVTVSLQYPRQLSRHASIQSVYSRYNALLLLSFLFFPFLLVRHEKSVVKNSASAVATPCNGPGFVQTSQELERKVCSGGDRSTAGRMTSNELVATRRQVRFRGCVTVVSSVFQADQNTVAFLLFSLSSLFPLICGQGGTLADRTKGSIGFFWTKGGEAERGKSVVFFGENRGEENASFPFCVPRSSSSSWLSSSKRPALILGARVGPSSLLLAATFTKYSILPCPVLSYPDQVSYVPRALCSLS